MNELIHYGVKGQRWGIRRYQNADGSLTQAGKNKYRKQYDDVKKTQILSERSYTENSSKTPISSLNKYANNYNYNYYNNLAKTKLNNLVKKIGKKGLSQLDDDVIREGKQIALKVQKETELFNKKIDIRIDDNYLFLKDPKEEYDYAYRNYIKNNLITRY